MAIWLRDGRTARLVCGRASTMESCIYRINNQPRGNQHSPYTLPSGLYVGFSKRVTKPEGTLWMHVVSTFRLTGAG
jgi:hypothetical protein